MYPWSALITNPVKYYLAVSEFQFTGVISPKAFLTTSSVCVLISVAYNSGLCCVVLSGIKSDLENTS